MPHRSDNIDQTTSTTDHIHVPPRPSKPRARKSSAASPSLGQRLTALRDRVRSWRLGYWSKRISIAILKPTRGVAIALIVLVVLFVANIIYQVVRKPTELFVVAGHSLDKDPMATWREYGPLFRTYATATITPELLAGLAQVESTGNPVARTYWRWQVALNPFSIYKPASSAVGLFQMTDGAFAEAAPFCIHDNEVEDDCGIGNVYIRTLPRHAIELTAIYLDRNVKAVLARAAGDAKPTAREKQDLATVIHLCGAGPAAAFVRRGFKPGDNERCGDHSLAGYLSRVNAMKQTFLRMTGGSKP